MLPSKFLYRKILTICVPKFTILSRSAHFISYIDLRAPTNLFYIPDTRWIKALSKLRMSSHMLEIARGRHVKPQKIPLEQRLCQRCTSNCINDEIHFLIGCPFFATQRTSLLAESKLHIAEFDSLSND